MCTVVSSWLRSSYNGSSSYGVMKQNVLPRIIFADLPVLSYVRCSAVSNTSKSWRIKVVAFKIAIITSVRHGTLKLTKKKTLLVGAQTRVDMNMITQLRFDYVRDLQTLLQSTVSCAAHRRPATQI